MRREKSLGCSGRDVRWDTEKESKMVEGRLTPNFNSSYT